MERETNNQLIFIDYDCVNKMKNEDIDFLKSNFREFDWEDQNTFYTIINYDPTLEILRKSYAIPGTYGYGPDEHQKKTVYDKREYLTIEEIETFNCFNYLEDKVYWLINDDDDIRVVESSKLHLVTSRILKYLEDKKLVNYHDETIKEFNDLEMLSKIGAKYEANIKIFDDYFWGDMYL